ncbi:MAG: 4-hydroxy-tetrahydrodipicolinate reductase [Candidatus Amoebophilus sp. 36-38]|nr:MAG: 4-hydroxy-tetrahydrodipicolinate reductase [Candidatus Amoebophilus sp. 36-38]
MRIGLVGYGKMGKAIEQIALQRGHTVSYRINHSNRDCLKYLTNQSVDVAIEFSQPEAAYENIYTCLQQGIPVIAGTTGWLDRKKEIEQYCYEKNGTFFYAPNFSLSVHIFFKLNVLLAKYMNRCPDYEVRIEETHHTTKKDQPSGTAIQLADGIIQNLNRKKGWINTPTQEVDTVGIVSHRVPESTGTHVVEYNSKLDTLEIKHIAHSRESFAQGVLLVAEWIRGKKGVLDMDDFMKFEDN